MIPAQVVASAKNIVEKLGPASDRVNEPGGTDDLVVLITYLNQLARSHSEDLHIDQFRGLAAVCEAICERITISLDAPRDDPIPHVVALQYTLNIQHICFFARICSKTLDYFINSATAWQPMERFRLLSSFNLLYEFAISPRGLAQLTKDNAQETEIFQTWGQCDGLVNFLTAIDGALESIRKLKMSAIARDPEIASVVSKAMIDEKIVKVASNCSKVVANPCLESWFSISVFNSIMGLLYAIPEDRPAYYSYWRDDILKGRLAAIFPEQKKYIDSPYDAKDSFKHVVENEELVVKVAEALLTKADELPREAPGDFVNTIRGAAFGIYIILSLSYRYINKHDLQRDPGPLLRKVFKYLKLAAETWDKYQNNIADHDDHVYTTALNAYSVFLIHILDEDGYLPLGERHTEKYYLEAVEAAGAIASAWGNTAVLTKSKESSALIKSRTKVLPALHAVMERLFVHFHFLPSNDMSYSKYSTVPICQALLRTFELTLNAAIAHLSLSYDQSRKLNLNPNPMAPPPEQKFPFQYSHRLCPVRYAITIWSGAGTILNHALTMRQSPFDPATKDKFQKKILALAFKGGKMMEMLPSDAILTACSGIDPFSPMMTFITVAKTLEDQRELLLEAMPKPELGLNRIIDCLESQEDTIVSSFGNNGLYGDHRHFTPELKDFVARNRQATESNEKYICRAKINATLECANVKCCWLPKSVGQALPKMRCSGCKVVYYCSAARQRKDWTKVSRRGFAAG